MSMNLQTQSSLNGLPCEGCGLCFRLTLKNRKGISRELPTVCSECISKATSIIKWRKGDPTDAAEVMKIAKQGKYGVRREKQEKERGVNKSTHSKESRVTLDQEAARLHAERRGAIGGALDKANAVLANTQSQLAASKEETRELRQKVFTVATRIDSRVIAVLKNPAASADDLTAARKMLESLVVDLMDL